MDKYMRRIQTYILLYEIKCMDVCVCICIYDEYQLDDANSNFASSKKGTNIHVLAVFISSF